MDCGCHEPNKMRILGSWSSALQNTTGKCTTWPRRNFTWQRVQPPQEPGAEYPNTDPPNIPSNFQKSCSLVLSGCCLDSVVQIYNSGHHFHGTVKAVFKYPSLQCKPAGRDKSRWGVHRGYMLSVISHLLINLEEVNSIYWVFHLEQGRVSYIVWGTKLQYGVNRIRHFLYAYDMNKVWMLRNYCFWHTGL